MVEPLRFKVDENLPLEVAEHLRDGGYDAASVQEEALQGAMDDDLIDICLKEQRILVTLDLDFADIRVYPPQNYPGLIVLRLHKQDKISLLKVWQRTVPLLDKEPIEQRIWIVDESHIRIRG